MAALKITRVGGEVVTYTISPAVEYAFELKYNIGFHKAFREEEKQTHLYFLAWECVRSNGVTVPEFGLAFLQTLVSVSVEDDEASKKRIERDSVSYTAALLALEYHISPKEILSLEPRMYAALIQVLNDRAKEARDAQRSTRKR